MASLHKLGLDEVDLYLVHTPFAFAPGDDQDPRHPHGTVVYDDGVTLQETWAAMESLVDAGLSRAIGLSDIDVEGTRQIVFCSEAGLASPFMRERDRAHNDSRVVWGRLRAALR